MFNMQLLVRYGVHPNPGPPDTSKKPNLSLITFNCRGLRNKAKLRGILAKVNKLVNNGAIVALQETHAIDESLLKMYWKHNYILNCSSRDQKGVALLFNSNFVIVKEFRDDVDRQIIVSIRNESLSLIVANVYGSNNVAENNDFYERLHENLLVFSHESPESSVVVMGDFNVCMSSGDYINRRHVQAERDLAQRIINNNDVLNLHDAYRCRVSDGGYTWARGTCFSRLDYVFVSESLVRFITHSDNDWAFGSSDHAAVKIQLSVPEERVFGPGITKVNTTILRDPIWQKKVEDKLKFMLGQIPPDWNPHVQLEFVKVSIRSVFSEIGGEAKKERIKYESFIEEELNQLIKLKQNLLINNNVSNEEKNRRINNIDNAIDQIRIKVNASHSRYTDELAFKSKVRWFELGEKSNKYFLGLLKMRQNQKYMNSIICDGILYRGFEEVKGAVREFYKKLYNKVETINNVQEEVDFFKHCPSLTENQQKYVNNPLTIEELRVALKSCGETSPGPDGITYAVYKSYWETLAPFLLNAWNYSLEKGNLPTSNLESVITLLPKQGKDAGDVKNWRPISLSNCDSKIITKAISIRVSKVLSSIIDSSQTAYVPTRSVMDNLRSNFILKKYCSDKKIDAVLISLDAKKAFDSVSHDYIVKVLTKYGFGPNFTNCFRTLYNNISSSVMVNGFKSDVINIKRGVKQGDALSCALFILCIDPLIRNIKENPEIEGITLKSKLNNVNVNFKVSGYADDIAVICRSNNQSINAVFKEYERLTRISGLELNADKTEILNLNTENPLPNLTYKVNYLGESYDLVAVRSLKICGLIFSSCDDDEYLSNVQDKIVKLEGQLKKWMVRNLTLEGKILIVKTFGLSQLIYNMQCYEFRQVDLVIIERLIFKFLWSKKWKESRPIERISRKILKSPYEKGGLNAPDVECLNRALKLKQFIRSDSSNHPISTLQLILLNNIRYEKALNQEYSRSVTNEPVINSSQSTINKLTDHDRLVDYGGMSVALNSTHAINTVSSINIEEYLKRKGEIFVYCTYRPLQEMSILNLNELLLEREISIHRSSKVSIENALSRFDEKLIQIAEQFNEDINSLESNDLFFLTSTSELKNASSLDVKEMQKMLKIAYEKCETLKVETKNNLENFTFDMETISKFRVQCKEVKMRNVFYRLLNKDFFYAERMFRYKMVESPTCKRCGEIETNNHLLFECRFTVLMWSIYNKVLRESFNSKYSIRRIEDIFDFNNGPIENGLKIKLINELIQIDRPMYWTKEKILNIATEMKNIEKYIAIKNNKNLLAFDKKWKT
jgi:exonuclease III